MVKIISCLTGVMFMGASSLVQAKDRPDSIVQMCATAQKEVVDDTAKIDLSYLKRGRNKLELADEVNRQMSIIVKNIREQYPDATFVGQNYQSGETYLDDKQEVKGWEVSQRYQVETKSMDTAGRISALVQANGGVVDSVSTFLSLEGARRIQTELYDEALADVQSRLASIAKAFGNSPQDWEVADMNTMPNNPCSGYQNYDNRYSFVGLSAKAASTRAAPAAPTIVEGRQAKQLSFWINARLKK